MLDARLRGLIDPPLDRIAAWLPLSPDAATLLGFAIGLLAVPALALKAQGLALALILINRLFDGLDGALARRTKPTDRGGFLDITCDFILYAAVPFGFALADPQANALPAAFLIFSFFGTGGSFLAFAVMAAKRGLSTELRGRKSLYYLGGLTEGAETIATFVLMCLLPSWFSLFAWVFGSLCWLTTLTRFAIAWQTLRPHADQG